MKIFSLVTMVFICLVMFSGCATTSTTPNLPLENPKILPTSDAAEFAGRM